MGQNKSNITVIAVGVEGYQNLESMQGPADDVANLKDLLVDDEETALFIESQFIELIDPTYDDLRTQINQYAISCNEDNSVLIFYFSGHGIPINNYDFGFCTIDTLLHESIDGVVFPYPLSVIRFSDFLQTLFIRHITPIIIIDACYSGLAGHFIDPQVFNNLRREVQKENASTFALLCSCNGIEQSINIGTGGLFSHYLVEAARNGLPKTRGRIPFLSLQDIFPNLSTQVMQYTQGTNTPQLFVGLTLPPIPLVKNTQYEPQSYQMNPQLISVIKALWNNGHEQELTPKEIGKLCDMGAYGNHRKLSLEPWRLVEDGLQTKKGGPKKRKLTERGRNFIHGKMQIPKKIIRDPDSGEFIADPDTIYVNIKNYSN